MVEIEIMTCGHLRPLAPQRPLAATCGHSSGCKWLRVAAGHCEGAHHWTDKGKKWKFAKTATCGHLRSLEWLQVAASGHCQGLWVGARQWTDRGNKLKVGSARQTWNLEKKRIRGKQCFFQVLRCWGANSLEFSFPYCSRGKRKIWTSESIERGRLLTKAVTCGTLFFCRSSNISIVTTLLTSCTYQKKERGRQSSFLLAQLPALNVRHAPGL